MLTLATGINNRGGHYLDNEAGHGFLLRRGQFTTIDVPGSPNTFTEGNRERRVASFVEANDPLDTNDVSHGFLMKHGIFLLDRFFRAPRAPERLESTPAVTSSAAGVQTPYVRTALSMHSFSLRAGSQASRFPEALETVAWGINASGQIVGHYFGEDDAFHGFLRAPR